MSITSRRRRSFHPSVATCTLAAALLLAACGGGSSDGDREGANPAVGGADPETAMEVVEDAIADTPTDATATVVLEGSTYQFRAVDDPAGEATPFCTTVAGSLQGSLVLVDESGSGVEGGEVTFTLFEPDADYAMDGSLQEVWIELPPDDPEVIGTITYMSEGETIESTVSGRSASANFTSRKLNSEVATGTIEVSC